MTTPSEDAGDTAYLTLEAAIRRGDLSPNERLVEQALAERFNLSRAAVRMAVVRLEQDGVAVRERNRGARVRAVSEAEAIEILEVRAALEGIAARRAAERATDADIAELRRLMDELSTAHSSGDLIRMAAANARLDRRIVDLSGNGTVRRVAQSLDSHLVRFQYRTILVLGRPVDSLAEHREVVEAIGRHDPDAAEAAMRTHLENVARTLRLYTSTDPKDSELHARSSHSEGTAG